MARHGDVLEAAVGRVTEAVTAAAWSGPDHDGFVDEWHTTHAAALRAAAQDLMEAGRRVVENADDQERTSESYDGGGPGAGPSAPRPAPEGTDLSSSEGQGDKAVGDLGDLEDAGEVPLDDQAIDASEIDQGSLADCWFLASAGAIAEQNPEWIQDHIKYNAEDGTHTVTFYEDGEPVEITVDSNVYEGAAGDPSGDPSWISIYEKAAVEFLGGEYDDIEYDNPARALEMMTGKDTSSDSLDPTWPWQDPPSLESIGERLENGEPVVASSPDGGGWFGDPPPDKEVVNNHVYTVESVSEDGKTITLVNPWGPGGGTGSDGETKPGTITMTADEFYENFETVTYGGSMS
ncbi:C2 family cysteine protease [Myceligenerans pegani]|nr:C2 family cysteine protease [Myceligenerans sp. TRM 65318]MBE3021176.1 hypothetical protein [Myceligenerans sp. TRM 65318]